MAENATRTPTPEGMTRERPILFSAPMVRAILAGTKTQTRRVIKDQSIGERYSHPKDDGSIHLEWQGDPCCGSGVWNVPEYSGTALCPYGLIGDRLWVREAFSGPHCMGDAPPSKWGACSRIWYWADGNPAGGDWTKPKPSIHMPRWASRITLEVTGVRVERLQAISEADALAEGIVETCGGYGLPGGSHFHSVDPRESYWSLWEAINGPGSVQADPWVWVVEFRRLTHPTPISAVRRDAGAI